MLEEKDEQQVVEEQVADDQNAENEGQVEETKESEQRETSNESDNQDGSEDQEGLEDLEGDTSLKTALKRANRRLRKERQNRARLEDRLNQMEQRFSKLDSKQEGDVLLKELENELGLDSDQTQKFYGAVDKIIEKRLGNINNVQNQPGNLTPQQATFAQRAAQEMSLYPEEDRGKLSEYAQLELKKDMEELQKLGEDPNEALEEDPKVYITRAYRAMLIGDNNLIKENEKQKMNGYNRASTESSRDGVKKPLGNQKITQEVFNKNRTNPEWVKKNRNAILEAARSGLIKGR